MLKSIVTPIDGSRHAQAALLLSAELAAKYDANLLLLHVGLRDGDVPKELYDKAASELAEAETRGEKSGVYPHLSRHLRVLEYLGHMLLRQAKTEAEGRGARQIETRIDFGDTGERILHHAKQADADLIAMGSRGFNEWEGMLLGSVSHKVIHLAPCSCVTVRQVEGQKAFEDLKSIVVPTDGSAHAAKAIDLASDIAAKCGAKLTLLHVLLSFATPHELRAAVDLDKLSAETRAELEVEPQAPVTTYGDGFIPPPISDGALREIGEQILTRARRAAADRGVADPNLVLAEDDPARRILETAKQEDADLIAMGSRGLGELSGLMAGSVSYKVNHAAPCSCLVVR